MWTLLVGGNMTYIPACAADRQGVLSVLRLLLGPLHAHGLLRATNLRRRVLTVFIHAILPEILGGERRKDKLRVVLLSPGRRGVLVV